MEKLAQKFHQELPFPGIRKKSAVNQVLPPKNLRAVVLGKDGVGKTAFTVRLLTKRFIGDYDRTLETCYSHRVEVDGQHVTINILDTAGENSRDKIDQCTKEVDIFFVLYSSTERSTFSEANLITTYLLSKKIPPSKIMLIATKIDLAHDQDVSNLEGGMLALNLGCSFHNISSAEGFSSTQEVLFASVRKALNLKSCPLRPDQRAKAPVARYSREEAFKRGGKRLHNPLSKQRSKSL